MLDSTRHNGLHHGPHYGQAAPRTKPLPPPALEAIDALNSFTEPRTDELLAVLPALERGQRRRPFENMTVSPAVLASTSCRERASMRAAWARGEYSPTTIARVGVKRLLLRTVEMEHGHDILCIAQFARGDVWMGFYDDLDVKQWEMDATVESTGVLS